MNNHLGIAGFIFCLLFHITADGKNMGKDYKVKLQGISLTTEDVRSVVSIFNRLNPQIWSSPQRLSLIESVGPENGSWWCYEIDTRTFYEFEITHPSGKSQSLRFASSRPKNGDLMTEKEYDYLKSLVYQYLSPFRSMLRDAEYEITYTPFRYTLEPGQKDSAVVISYRLTPEETNAFITAYEYAWSSGTEKHLSGASYSMWEEKAHVYRVHSVDNLGFACNDDGIINYSPDNGVFLQMRDEDRNRTHNIIVKYFGRQKEKGDSK